MQQDLTSLLSSLFSGQQSVLPAVSARSNMQTMGAAQKLGRTATAPTFGQGGQVQQAATGYANPALQMSAAAAKDGGKNDGKGNNGGGKGDGKGDGKGGKDGKGNGKGDGKGNGGKNDGKGNGGGNTSANSGGGGFVTPVVPQTYTPANADHSNGGNGGGAYVTPGNPQTYMPGNVNNGNAYVPVQASERVDHGNTDGNNGNGGNGGNGGNNGGGGGGGGGGGNNGGGHRLSDFEKLMNKIGNKGRRAYPNYVKDNVGFNNPTIGYGTEAPKSFKSGMATKSFMDLFGAKPQTSGPSPGVSPVQPITGMTSGMTGGASGGATQWPAPAKPDPFAI